MDTVVSESNCVLNEFCRLCASKSKNGITIYSPEGYAQCLAEKITYCLRIAVTQTDLLPKHVCSTCHSRLDDYHKFTEDANKVQQSLQILVQMKNSDILNETPEFSDDVLVENKKEQETSILETALENLQNDYYTDISPSIQFKHETGHQENVQKKDYKKRLKTVQTCQKGEQLKTLVSKVLKETTNKSLCSTEINQEDISKRLHNDEDMSDNDDNEESQNIGIKCNQCSIVIALRSQFDLHYQTSYNKKPIYTCSFCNKSIEKYTTFRSHCYRHTTEGKFRCEFCNKGFYLRNLLDLHIASKHTKVKPFICESCGKGFITHNALNNHMKSHMVTKNEDFPCKECGKVLHTRGGFVSHTNAHKLGRRFMCDLCGKTFTQKVNMQHHVKLHYGDKPYACEKCGKSFSEKSHLKRHYNLHSEKRPFKCSICSKMYKTERCLKVHNKVHSEARPYVCSVCNKGFLSVTKLKQHSNIHTGERPYKCNYCERTFTNFPNWLKHTRRRHKVNHKTGEVIRPQTGKDSFPASNVKANVESDNRQHTENVHYPMQALSYATYLNPAPLLYSGQNLNSDIFILSDQILPI